MTANRLSLDVRLLQRRGLLEAGTIIGAHPIGDRQQVPPIQLRVGIDDFTLTVRRQKSGGDRWATDYHVRLERTPCNYGGSRAWFLCPKGCGRRVALLYFGERHSLACRHCCKLAYRSQRETETRRLLRRANNIRKKLGWTPGVIRGHGPKPKGMHVATFRRLTKLHDAYAAEGLTRLLGNVFSSLELKFARQSLW